MKATILFTSLIVLIGSMIYISKPSNAVGSGVSQSKNGSSQTYTTTFVIECPVAEIQPKYDYTSTDDNNIVMQYDHCKHCSTGVYLQSKNDDEIRCTFCRKLKN
jgi:hypothetical protein